MRLGMYRSDICMSGVECHSQTNGVSTLRRLLFAVLCVLVLSVCGAANGYAQQTTGTIVGSVLDPGGAQIPRAVVKATNVDTGISRTTSSNDQGDYRIDNLAVGRYSLEVSAPNFKGFVQKNIVLTVDQVQRVNAALAVGSQTETITVTDTPPAINTATQELGRTVQADEIIGLPLVNRNVYTQLTLTPGVQTSSSSGANGASGNFILGLPSQSTVINGGYDAGVGSVSYYLDGGINMTGLRNYGNPAPNPDALQEFRVETNNYNAQYGRFSSGVVTILTHSGTNQFHGSLFEFVRNTALNATPWGATLNAPYHRNQFGGAFGGPIIQNRTFFFFSYAGLRQSTGNFLSGAIVPTALERTGDFSQSAIKPINPNTGVVYAYGGVPGKIDPGSIDPTAAKIINTYIPLPNIGTNGWQGYFVGPYTSNEFLGKIDHEISPKNHLTVSYFNIKTLQQTIGGGNLLWSTQTGSARQHNVNISDTQTFSPTLLNSVWLTYTRNFGGRVNTPGISLGDLGSTFAIQGPKSLPAISVTGYFSLGQSIQGPTAGSNFYSVRDVVSKSIGKHTLSLGGEMSLDKDIQVTDLDNFGVFSFSTSAPHTTKNALADFVTGRPATMEQDSIDEALANSWYYAFFAQDDYRISPRLTLNLGLRYDFQTPPTDNPQNRELTFKPGVQSTLIPTAPLGLLFAGDPGVTRGTVSMKWHHVSPRLGFALDPFSDGKTSVRGAFGIFYGAVGGNEWEATSNGVPFALRQTYASIASLSNVYGDPASFPTGNPFPYVYNPKNALFLPNSQVIGTALNFQWPYSYQVNTSIQRALPGNASVTVAYVGAFTHHVPLQVDANYAQYATGATTSQTSINSRRPYDPGQLGTVTLQTSGQTASYNGLQLSVNKRLSKNFSANGFYVWSHSFVSADPTTAAGGSAQVQDYNHLEEERGPSDQDFRHMASMSGVWNLTYYHGTNKFVSTALNGWEIAPIVTLNSGVPLNITTGADKNADGNSTDRPNLVPGVSAFLDPHRSRPAVAAQWFNTAAFTANGPGLGIGPGGADGNTPRAYLRSPGYRDVDLGIFRTIHLYENFNLQLRGEASNAFNLVSLSAPTASLSSGNNGKITSASAPRQIQIGAKLTF